MAIATTTLKFLFVICALFVYCVVSLLLLLSMIKPGLVVQQVFVVAAPQQQQAQPRPLLDAAGKPVSGPARLFVAARNDDAALLAALVAQGETLAARDDENGATALHVAAYFGARRAVRFILWGIVDGNDAGQAQRNDGDGQSLPPPVADAAALLGLRDAHGATALHYAAAMDRVEVARLLLLAGADVTAQSRQGATPLYDAARAGSRRTLELLARRARATLETPAADGTRPLYAAAAHGHEACVEVLAEEGACVACTQDNARAGTALHATAERGALASALVLLEYGARADAVDADGLTPLHIAVHTSQQPVYGALKYSAHGAAAEATRSHNGVTPRELAEQLGYVLLQ